jgi:ketosteroid isomerase-like protein
MPMVCVLLLSTPHLGTPHPATPRHEADLDSLISAERAFSLLSVDRGMKEAFLSNLAENSVLFRPLPMSGQELWKKLASPPATLIWEPAYAEVSGAGDLGVSTGPWEMRPPPSLHGSTLPLHGHFISIWRKQPDGTWKVELDLGVSHVKPERGGVGSGEIVRGPIHADPPATDRTKQALADIASAERRFSEAARRSGLAAALPRWTTSDLRFNREGHVPSYGSSARREMVKADSGAVSWSPQNSGASRSGDLGYTYGIRQRRRGKAAPDSSVYVNVWRRDRDGRWRVSLMVDNPLR